VLDTLRRECLDHRMDETGCDAVATRLGSDVEIRQAARALAGAPCQSEPDGSGLVLATNARPASTISRISSSSCSIVVAAGAAAPRSNARQSLERGRVVARRLPDRHAAS
jgi:hypothetical protein